MKSKTVFAYVLYCSIFWSAAGQAELSTNVALTSDYIWRAVSQTLGDPAVQAGVDSAPEDDDEADVELDLYVGYGGETEGGFGWDVGVIQYRFPGARKSLLNTSEEVYIGASYDFFSLMLYQDFDNETTYVEAGLEFALPYELSLGLHAGHFDFDDSADYADYRISLSRTIAEFDFSLDYTDTNLSNSECADGYWFRDLCGGTFSLTVSREFTF